MHMRNFATVPRYCRPMLHLISCTLHCSHAVNGSDDGGHDDERHTKS